MTGPATDPTRGRDEVASATEALVANWIVPEVIPQGICTAVVPGTECLDGARLLARTLHTLVLRSRPRTLVLAASGPGQVARIRAMGSLSTTLGDVPIDERLAARIASFWPDEIDIIPDGEDEDSLPTLHRIGPLLAQVLVPGCRIVPLQIPAAPEQMFDPVLVGREMGKQLKFEVGCCLIASGTLFPRDTQEPNPASTPTTAQEVSEDASILKHLLEPEADELAGRLSQTGLQNTSALLLATAYAIECDRKRGHLLEHGVVETDGHHFGAAAVVL
ncbi:MAG: hypothetical protein VX949_04860 [Planctomycetota bacterium]|nr:hypothetical protein [Planctomycetota bacterium]